MNAIDLMAIMPYFITLGTIINKEPEGEAIPVEMSPGQEAPGASLGKKSFH